MPIANAPPSVAQKSVSRNVANTPTTQSAKQHDEAAIRERTAQVASDHETGERQREDEREVEVVERLGRPRSVPKPKTRPPASAAQVPVPSSRHRRNVHHAASAGASELPGRRTSATGPMAAVSGQASSDGPGMELVQARFQPSGAKTRFVSSGWSPCSIACGHQASDQAKLAWSDP